VYTCSGRCRLTNACSRPGPAVPVSQRGKISRRARAAEARVVRRQRSRQPGNEFVFHGSAANLTGTKFERAAEELPHTGNDHLATRMRASKRPCRWRTSSDQRALSVPATDQNVAAQKAARVSPILLVLGSACTGLTSPRSSPPRGRISFPPAGRFRPQRPSRRNCSSAA
jgi:hypothetical protein